MKEYIELLNECTENITTLYAKGSTLQGCENQGFADQIFVKTLAFYLIKISKFIFMNF